MTTEITNSDDLIDVRDTIARVEELREESKFWNARSDADDTVQSGVTGDDVTAEADELAALEALLSDLAGNGGDEQWEGDWYPVSLIRDSYFVEAMRELVSDIGDLPRDIPTYLEIDWEKTAANLRMDYSSVEFGGVTYWYR